MMKWLIVVVVCLLFLSAAGQTCVQRSSCSCENADGLVDLSPLGNKDGTPRFKDITEPSGLFTYSWNPCYSINVTSCQNVSMCQYDKLKRTSYSLGTQTNVDFLTTGQTIVIEYSADTDLLRTVDIQLICDHQEEGTFQFISESPITFYNFQLKSKYACPKPKYGGFRLSSDGHQSLQSLKQSNEKSGSTHLILTLTTPESFTLKTTTLILCSILLSAMFLVSLSVFGLSILLSRHQHIKLEESTLRRSFFHHQFLNNDDMDFFTDTK